MAVWKVVLAPARLPPHLGVCVWRTHSQRGESARSLVLQCPPGTGHHSQGSDCDLAPGGRWQRGGTLEN